MLTKKCHYTGVSIAILSRCEGHNPQQLTIDRIDPDKPYTVDNCVACSHSINLAKATFEIRQDGKSDFKDLIALAEGLKDFYFFK